MNEDQRKILSDIFSATKSLGELFFELDPVYEFGDHDEKRRFDKKYRNACATLRGYVQKAEELGLKDYMDVQDARKRLERYGIPS